MTLSKPCRWHRNSGLDFKIDLQRLIESQCRFLSCLIPFEDFAQPPFFLIGIFNKHSGVLYPSCTCSQCTSSLYTSEPFSASALFLDFLFLFFYKDGQAVGQAAQGGCGAPPLEKIKLPGHVPEPPAMGTHWDIAASPGLPGTLWLYTSAANWQINHVKPTPSRQKDKNITTSLGMKNSCTSRNLLQKVASIIRYSEVLSLPDFAALPSPSWMRHTNWPCKSFL